MNLRRGFSYNTITQENVGSTFLNVLHFMCKILNSVSRRKKERERESECNNDRGLFNIQKSYLLSFEKGKREIDR